MQEIISPKDITLETSLLKAMSIKATFDAYIDSVDYSRLLPSTSLLLKDYVQYFSLFKEHEQIDFGEFQTQFANNWHYDFPILTIDYYRDYVIPAIQKYDNSDIETSLLGLLKKQVATKIIEETNSSFDVSVIRQTLDDYELKQTSIKGEEEDDACTVENADFSILDRANGIPYFLPSIQSGLGSLVKGQFVVVPADYGTGKTAFVVSQAVHTFKHLIDTNDYRPILYFNSEGTKEDVLTKFLANLYHDIFKGGFEEILENRDVVKEMFLSHYPNNQFRVYQINSNGLYYLREKLSKFDAALVIIDIADALAPEEDVQSLKKLYDKLRLLSATYCPIMATSQSGDQSYVDKNTNEIKNRKWLGEKALYGSRPGKGGAADTIITIGKDDNHPNIRYIATPKKKRGDSVKITCQLEDKYALYREIIF